MRGTWNLIFILSVFAGINAQCNDDSSVLLSAPDCQQALESASSQSPQPLSSALSANPYLQRLFFTRLLATPRIEVKEFDSPKVAPVLSALAEGNRRTQMETAAKVRGVLSNMGMGLDVRTMLYPASGLDSVAPFMILPHLESVIAFDSHPFRDTKREEPIEARFGPIDLPGGFNQVEDVTTAKFTSDFLIGRLLSQFPSARILKVIGIRPSAQQVPAHRDFFPHGVIVFDQGPDTTVQTFVHLQVSTRTLRQMEYTQEDQSELLNRISELDYQAILRKGAMVYFQQDSTQAAVRPLVEKLFYRNGLWIDGDQSEGIPGLRQLAKSWKLTLPIRRATSTPLKGFGYGNVEIMDF